MANFSGHGTLRIIPYKLIVDELSQVQVSLRKTQYDQLKCPTMGYRGMCDEEYHSSPIEIKKFQEINYLSAEFIEDRLNEELQRLLPPKMFNELPIEKQYVKSSTKFISYKINPVFLLLNTSNLTKIKRFEENGLMKTGVCRNRASFIRLPDEFRTTHDFMLWLIFIERANTGVVNSSIYIQDIEYVLSNDVHKILYSGHSSHNLRELCTSIVEERPFSSVKINLKLDGVLYTFLLNIDGSTEIYPSKTTAHLDITNPQLRREAIFLDIYSKCIPQLKAAYEGQLSTWPNKRKEFIDFIAKAVKDWRD